MNDAPIAYARSGSLYACGDGPELWVYAGADDVPRWKKFCDGIIVGVGVREGEVLCLDSEGRLFEYRATDGLPEREILLDRPCTALALGPERRCAAIVDGGVVLIDASGETRAVDLPHATTAGFAYDGTLCVGTSAGGVHILNGATGAVIAHVSVGGAVSGLAHSRLGVWAVASGARLSLVGSTRVQPPAQGDEPPPPPRTVWQVQQTLELDGPAGSVAASDDGVVIATALTEGRVALVEAHGRKAVGLVTVDRDVGALAFGPAGWLAIGLDNAEASRFDVLSGATAQTLSGLGRQVGRWRVSSSIDMATLRGAKAAAMTGGGAIAREIERKSFGLPPVPTTPQGRSQWMLYGGVGCVSLALLCGGSSCCTGLLYALW